MLVAVTLVMPCNDLHLIPHETGSSFALVHPQMDPKSGLLLLQLRRSRRPHQCMGLELVVHSGLSERGVVIIDIAVYGTNQLFLTNNVGQCR